MGLIVKIAFLNVLRNSRRSTITILAILFGSVSIIVFGGYVESMYDGLRESMIRSQLAHLQIYQKGFSELSSTDPEKVMLSPESVNKIIEIVTKEPGVTVATGRLNFSGLLSNGSHSLGVVGLGMDAEKEASMNSAVAIVEGDDLFEDEMDSALLGRELAANLKAKPGDVLTLLATTPDGAMNAVDITVSGIMTTGVKAYDERVVRLNLSHARNLLYTDKLTRIVVLLEETKNTEAMRDRLITEFEKAGLEVEIKTWHDLADFYKKVVGLFQNIFGFIKIIVMAIVIMGIANTMLMAVMERTSEIGTIRALGNTRREVLLLFLNEAFFLGLIGGILGIVVGILLAKGITNAGLMMPPPPGSTNSFPIRIYIVDKYLYESLFLGVTAAIVSSIYPAIKASRLKIVDALRFI